MKKVIVILFALSMIYLIDKKNEIIIPNDAVRFRIIANSNSLSDQTLKNTIKDDLINNIFPKIKSKEDIKNNLENIENVIKKYKVDYKINYGINYFPEKEYKGIKYPKGNYESLVITLNNGLGNNFWCVMYPSLCLIENNNTNEIEYKSLVKEIIDNYNNNVN